MTTLLVEPLPSDEEVAARVFAGDADALVVLYDRYAHRVYDLALRVLRDPVTADDVVQATFINAWKHLKKRPVQGNIRAWLMAIARNNALDAVRSRKRLERLGSAPIETIEYAALAEAPEVNPEEMAHRREVADLVWEAASSLTPSEYSLLDLHVRQGLDADDLADRLGARKGSVHVRLFRMRDSLRKSVIAALMWRHPADCAFVERLKRDAPAGALTHDLRQMLLRHAEVCEVCGASTRKFANPIEIFAGLLAVPLPEASRVAMWESITAIIAGIAAGAAAGVSLTTALSNRISDFVSWGVRNARSLVAGTGAAAVAAIVAAVLIVNASGDDSAPPPLGVVVDSTATPTRQSEVLGITRVPTATSTRAPVPTAPRSPAAAPPRAGTLAPVAPAVPPTQAPTPTPIPPSSTPPPAATRSSGGRAATATRTSTATATATVTATASPLPTATPTQPASATCDGLEATIVGTNARDVLQGTDGRDVIVGLGGDDVIQGHGGDDVLCGGAGDDHLLGDHGDDALFGNSGADILRGHHGDDDLDGGSGPDACHGGPGVDAFTGCEDITSDS